MPTEQLGTLQRVDASALWNHEALDFTPWLLENEEGLADALGIELELEEAEHRVGAFSLDLVGRDATNDTILIIENQLAGTDHTHLGQILTYAAGTGASTIVWIATAFREEHRQALDWLNEQTGPDTHFFGIEIEAFRIGDSRPAPHFKVVAQPNEWQKVVRDAARGQKASGRAALYAEFLGCPSGRSGERGAGLDPTTSGSYDDRHQLDRHEFPDHWRQPQFQLRSRQATAQRAVYRQRISRGE